MYFRVSHTTRKPYAEETDGKDYNFVSIDQVENEVKMGKFLQTYSYSGNLYGLTVDSVEAVAREGLACVLHMELEVKERDERFSGQKKNLKQESPPAWTQEAYRPPRSHSNFLLCRGGGGKAALDKNFFSGLNTYQAKSGVKKFSLYWGGGGVPWQKFFSSLNMYQAKSGVKNFSLYWEGGSLDKNFFSSLNMYQAKSGVKIFSLYWGGGGGGGGGSPLQKFFFPVLNMYQAKSGVKNFSLYWEGGPSTKIFFPVWTCIKPNLVSKFFPFTGGGCLDKISFSSLNMYQAKSGVKIFSLYWGGGGWGGPWQKIFSSLNMYQAKSGVKIFSLYWVGGGPLNKNFFSSLNMYQAKSGGINLSLYWGGGSLDKTFFSQPEHVSSQIWCQKNFPLLKPGTPLPPWTDTHLWKHNLPSYVRTRAVMKPVRSLATCIMWLLPFQTTEFVPNKLHATSWASLSINLSNGFFTHSNSDSDINSGILRKFSHCTDSQWTSYPFQQRLYARFILFCTAVVEMKPRHMVDHKCCRILLCVNTTTGQAQIFSFRRELLGIHFRAQQQLYSHQLLFVLFLFCFCFFCLHSCRRSHQIDGNQGPLSIIINWHLKVTRTKPSFPCDNWSPLFCFSFCRVYWPWKTLTLSPVMSWSCHLTMKHMKNVCKNEECTLRAILIGR